MSGQKTSVECVPRLRCTEHDSPVCCIHMQGETQAQVYKAVVTRFASHAPLSLNVGAESVSDWVRNVVKKWCTAPPPTQSSLDVCLHVLKHTSSLHHATTNQTQGKDAILSMAIDAMTQDIINTINTESAHE